MTDTPPPAQPELRPWLPHALAILVFCLLCAFIAMLVRRARGEEDEDDGGGRGKKTPPQVPPSPEVRDEAKKRAAKAAARDRLIALNAKRKAEREAKQRETVPPAPPAAT